MTRRDQRALLRSRRGFTMVEVVIASALLGFSLVVMFGFHSQALRANMNARRLTDCTYLAQSQMERLLAVDWTSSASVTDLTDGGEDAAATPVWDDLEWPGGTVPQINALNSTPTTLSPAMYTVTWDVAEMDTNDTWVRLRVRCTYEDSVFNTRHGTTISSYRYRDS